MHVYNGAKGAEIAMLLRRVRDRVNNSTPGRIQFIGTSATLGTGKQLKEVAEYATALFDETVAHHETDLDLADVVSPQLATIPQRNRHGKQIPQPSRRSSKLSPPTPQRRPLPTHCRHIAPQTLRVCWRRSIQNTMS